MHPGFAEFAARLQERLLPRMAAVAQQLSADWPAFKCETFFHPADGFHSLGIWCARPTFRAAQEDDSCGIIVNVFGINDLSVRGFVQWNRLVTLRHDLVTYNYELMTPIYQPRIPTDVEAFAREAEKMYRALSGALRRGRPPGVLMRRWRQLLGQID